MHGKLRDTTMKTKKSSSILIFVSMILVFIGVSPVSDPHLVGKIKWVYGGTVGMKIIDWFDLLIHSVSFSIGLFLIGKLLIRFFKNNK